MWRTSKEKQAAEEVPLEAMTKSVKAYNVAKNIYILKATHVFYKKVTHYEVFKRWEKYVEQGGTTPQKAE